jgi:hypothetical protein
MHFQHQWHDGSKRYMFYMSGRDSELSNGLNLGFTDVFPSNETLNDGEKNNVIKNSDLVICSISAIHVYTNGRFVSRTAFEFVIGGKAAPGRVPSIGGKRPGNKPTLTILETRMDRTETGARLRSESEARCLVSRATRCCAPHAAARHLMRRSLAKCSRHRLINLQRKARFNIGYRVAN